MAAVKQKSKTESLQGNGDLSSSQSKTHKERAGSKKTKPSIKTQSTAPSTLSDTRRKNNKALGMRGEEAAARYLIKKGYLILERNWTCFAGEADIIARSRDALVFVEVKTRRDTGHGLPSEAVTPAKRERYEKIALAYITDNFFEDATVRFDVIAINVLTEDRAFIKHHISAFSVG